MEYADIWTYLPNSSSFPVYLNVDSIQKYDKCNK